MKPESEKVSPSILQLIGLVAITQINWIVWFIAFFGRWDQYQMAVVTNWTAVASTLGIIAYSFWICPVQHTKLFLARIRVSAGTPAAYAAFIPAIVTLVLTGIQLREKGSILLPYNPIYFLYDNRIYTYELAQWFFHFTSTFLIPLNFLWLTVMILVPMMDRTYDGSKTTDSVGFMACSEHGSFNPFSSAFLRSQP